MSGSDEWMLHYLSVKSPVSWYPSCKTGLSFGKYLYIFKGCAAALFDVDRQDKMTVLQMLWFNSKCLYIGISLVVEEKRIKTDSVTQTSISSTHVVPIGFRRRILREAFIHRHFLFTEEFCLLGNMQSRSFQD